LLSRFTHTLPDDLAAAISASDALLAGAGGAFLAVLAGAAMDDPADDDPEDDAAGALAAGAEAGFAAGAAAGAAMEPPAGAEPDAGAIAESAFLLFDDFLLVPASAAGVLADLAAGAIAELAPEADPAAGAIASAFALFFLEDLDEVLADDALVVAAELSVPAAAFFDLDFLVVEGAAVEVALEVELWPLVVPV
jgi:hypothetical protein